MEPGSVFHVANSIACSFRRAHVAEPGGFLAKLNWADLKIMTIRAFNKSLQPCLAFGRNMNDTGAYLALESMAAPQETSRLRNTNVS